MTIYQQSEDYNSPFAAELLHQELLYQETAQVTSNSGAIVTSEI
jgi:hypothetical protein